MRTNAAAKLGTDAVNADPTQAEGVPLVGTVPLVDNLPIFQSCNRLNSIC